jgi:protein SCO1
LQQARFNELTNSDLLDKWSFVVFGYTYCPDVCPTTLARIKAVYQQLKQTADVQVVFVSVDPLRDDIERLSVYVGYFEPDFFAVTTSHDKLFPFAQSLLSPYGIVAQAPGDEYRVSHSASIALINPQGNLQGQFKPGYKVGGDPHR